MLKIKKAEDFGLGFNCMTRLYMNSYDEEILYDSLFLWSLYLYAIYKQRFCENEYGAYVG